MRVLDFEILRQLKSFNSIEYLPLGADKDVAKSKIVSICFIIFLL